MSAHASPAEIRANLSHPIVDGDGHWLEYAPVFSEKMRKAGGDKGADGFLAALRSTTDALKLTAGRARPARRRAAEFLEPPGREHARPRHRDDAEDALLSGSTRSASISRSSIRPPGCACRASRTTRPGAP